MQFYWAASDNSFKPDPPLRVGLTQALGPMNGRQDYELALQIVGQVVRAWDPYTLLADGAPSDEFDAEIAQLVTRVPCMHSVADAAHAISAGFSKAFEPQLFTPAACAAPGAELFARLLHAELVAWRDNSFKPNPPRESA